MVTILDTTLREGELQPGVYFTRNSRITIGKALAEVGTPRIEFPIVYPSRGAVMEDVKAATDELQANYNRSTVILQIRAYKEDIDLARKYDVSGCAIYMAPTELHRKGKFRGMEQQKIIDNFIEMLDLVKSYGFTYRRATLEDVSRFGSPEDRGSEDTMEFLSRLLDAVYEAGATVISIPDTSGILPNFRCIEFLNQVRKLTGAPLACHFHNDYGNALANALTAATSPGVQEVHVSILGLGTRNGITDHYEFIANLEDHYHIESGEQRDKMRWLYETFSQATKIDIPWTHPLSQQCFTEKAGTHQSQVVKDARGYIPAKKLLYDSKGEVRFEAGQLMSRHVLAKIVEGYSLSDEAMNEIINNIAARSALRHQEVSPWEVRDIIAATSGTSIPVERVSKIIRGSDYAYIIMKMVPQSPVPDILEEVRRWPEVDKADEVYGNFDVIVLTRMNDLEGTPVVDKLRTRFRDAILETVTLPLE